MTLLLDTHVVLWWRLNSRRLGADVRTAIATADLVLVSAASGWELAIKQGLGKVTLSESFASMVASSDFRELPVTLRHTEQVAALPVHHADPFDRMLVAQAQVEGATLVTHDAQMDAYGVSLLRVR